MFSLFLALLISATVPSQAAPRVSTAPWDGSDISAFRAIHEEGLEQEQRASAYGDFMAAYPRSPLAEVALGLCVELGVDVELALEGLNPGDRSYLVSRYTAHRQHLAYMPAEGPLVSDADSARTILSVTQEEPSSPGQTKRAMRRSSR